MSVDKDLVSVHQARDLVEAAHKAFKLVAQFDQARIDRICAAMAAAALADAARLGALAVEETGFGVPADKEIKNRFAAEHVWNYFKSLKTVGIVNETKDIVEIASPRGVVAAIVPSTNPTSTAIFKCLIAIKSRNAIVLSPHPSAVRCITETVRVVREAATKAGLPQDAIGCMSIATIEGTQALMTHKLTAVILATGGIGLVRAAYSSGKPAFGVGPGNVPVFIERSADIGKAVQDILTSTCFDNGTICASEQAVVVDAPVEKQVREQFRAQGGHFLNADEAARLANVVATPQRTLNPAVVGKSAQHIAQLAGIAIPAGTRCLLADVAGVGRDHPLSMEKLSPILAFYVANGLEAGAARCLEILQYGGMGHTAGMHTKSREAALAYGREMPASRVIINSPTTHGAIGFSTALPPSMTLGCGSWGGNVTSDNVSPLHLLDIKRVAFETKPVQSNIKPQALAAAPALPNPAQAVRREDIAALVDKFLAGRPAQVSALVEAQTNAPAAQPAGTVGPAPGGNGADKSAVDFVSEDDVRRAIQKGAKIIINARTIITPAARDIGEPAEVFAKK